MKYAFSAAQLALLDKHPQRVEMYAAIHRPRIMAWGTLSAVPDNYPGSSISIKNVVAFYNLTDVLAGMTLRVGSESNKDDYGTIRVRNNYSSGSIIELAEFGSGLINWKAGACLTVVEEFRAWPVHSLYDTALSCWKVDLQNYTSQLSLYGPQAIMGPPAVTTLDGGKAVVPHVGNLSYSHTPGASITSQAWYFPNGQTVTSALGSSAAPVNITYINASPTGRYHALAVTDGNGSSHISKRLTFAFGSGADQQPPRVSFEAITGGLKSGGYRTRVIMHDNAPSGVLVDGAQVVIFEKASYGTIASSVGGNYYGRDNVVMVGRILNDSMRIEPFTQELSFTLETIDSELRKSNGYDLFLEGSSAASSWDMASNLTMDHMALALAKYRSTISNVADFHPAGGVGSSIELYYRSLPAGNLWDQLTYNYDGVFGIVAADMQGTIWAGIDAQVTGLSANLPVIIEITKPRRLNTTTIEHDHTDSNAHSRLYAIMGGTASPLGAESPGLRFGYFGGRVEVTRNLWTTDQDTLATWSGNVRARENNPYKRVTTGLAGNIRLDSVPQSLVTMSLSATENRRNISWENQKFIPTETTINYNPAMYANSEVVMESVVNGMGGSAITFPTASIPPTVPGTPPPGNPGDTGGFVVFALTNGTEQIVRTSNFLDASPTWTGITGTITGSISNYMLDPYDPANKAIVLSSTGIWYSSNIRATSPTWTQGLTAANIVSATEAGIDITGQCRLFTTINAQGRVYITAGGSSSTSKGVWTGASSDYTSTSGWTWKKLETSTNGGSYGIFLHVAQYDFDRVLVAFVKNANSYLSLFYSDNGGGSFSEYNFSSENFTSHDSFAFAPHLNGNNVIYLFNTTLGAIDGGAARMLKSTTGPSGPWTDISTTFSGNDIAGLSRYGSMTESPASDGTNLFVAATDDVSTTNSALLKYSGSSWTILQSNTDLRWGGYGFGGWPYNNLRLQMHNAGFGAGKVGRSADGGVTWINATGNLATASGGATLIDYIIPIWVDVL